MPTLAEQIAGTLGTLFNIHKPEHGLTPTQEDDAIKKAHDISASASEIDGNTLKTFTKKVKELQRNPIDGDFKETYNAYANCYNYNGEVFNAVKTFIKVNEATTLRVMILNPSEFDNANWWTRGKIAIGEIQVTPDDRYVIIPLDIECNSSNITEGYFYVSISAEGGQQLASHDCEWTDLNDGGFNDLYSVTTTQTETDGGYRFYSATNNICKFWCELQYIDYNGLRTESIEQELVTKEENSRVVHYPNFYNCEGVEAHIYFNNFKKSLVDNFGFKYHCKPFGLVLAVENRVGIQEDERLIKYNKNLVMGNREAIANINFFEKYYQELHDTVRFNHILVDADNGNGQTCNFVAIGESTTGNGYYVNRMVEIASTDVLTFVPLGTRTDGGTLHEGVGGKTMDWHVNAVESAFTDSNGDLDYTNFVSIIGATPDVLSIQLGINAMLLVKNKYDLAYYIDREMTAYNDFIAHVKLTHPNTKFIINTCILPSELQSSFGKNYDTYLQRDLYRESVQAYNEKLIELFYDREDENIYLNCTQTLQLDCKYGFDTEEVALSEHTTITIPRGASGSGVHPSQYGYKLMGDALWSCLKYLYKA